MKKNKIAFVLNLILIALTGAMAYLSSLLPKPNYVSHYIILIILLVIVPPLVSTLILGYKKRIKRKLTHITLMPTEPGLWVPMNFVTQVGEVYYHGYENSRRFLKPEINEAMNQGALWEICPVVMFDCNDHSRGTWMDEDNRIYWAWLHDPMADLDKIEVFLKKRIDEKVGC